MGSMSMSTSVDETVYRRSKLIGERAGTDGSDHCMRLSGYMGEERGANRCLHYVESVKGIAANRAKASDDATSRSLVDGSTNLIAVCRCR